MAQQQSYLSTLHEALGSIPRTAKGKARTNP